MKRENRIQRPSVVPRTTSSSGARWLPRAREDISKLVRLPTRSEDDLISKVVLPFFKILGYGDQSYELKYPVEGYLPHRSGRKPEADVVFFGTEEHSVDTSLVVAEVKREGRPLPEQQARFYAANLFVPYYVAWSGYTFEVWQLSNYHTPVLFEEYDLSSISEREISTLRNLLSPVAVSEFCNSNEIKHLTADSQLDATAFRYGTNLISGLSHFKPFVLPVIRDLNLQYIPLRLSELASAQGSVLGPSSGEDREAAPPKGAAAPHRSHFDLSYLVSEVPAIVVLGDPGAGKSTLLRKLCLEVAERGPRLPICLSAQELISMGESPTEGALRQIRQYGNTDTPEALFETVADQGRLLLCIDGMDELDLTDPQDARHAVRRIGSALTQLLSRHTWNRVVISARRESWPACRPLVWENFREFEIHPLRRRDARTFIRRWFEEPNSDGAPLIEDLRGRGWPTFATNPLLITLTCATFDRTRGLPRTLSELFESFLRKLVQEWNATWRISRHQPVHGLTFERILVLLSKLALSAHERHLTSFPRGMAEEVFSTNLRQAGLATENTEDVLAQISEQHGLLRSWSIDDHLAFHHLSFQSYLVARALRLQHAGHQLLLDKRDDPFWREAILLYAEQGDVTDLVKGLLAVEENIMSTNTLLASECWIGSGKPNDETVAQALVARLEALAKDAPSFISEKALQLAARLPSPSARQWIIRDLRDSSGRIQFRSPAANLAVEMFGERAIDEVIETLKDEGYSTKLMDNFRSLTRSAAIGKLSVLILQESWPAEQARGSDAGVRHIRRTAARLMAEIGEEDALTPLVTLLNAPRLSSFERAGIVSAIAQIDDDATRSILENILQNSEDTDCRIEAAARLAPRHYEAKQFLLTYVGSVQEDFYDRRDAASALAQFDLSDDDIEPLKRMLFDPNPTFWGGPACAARAVAAVGSDKARSVLEEARLYWAKSSYRHAESIRSAIGVDLARIDEDRDPGEVLLAANDPETQAVEWDLPRLARDYVARAPAPATNLFVDVLRNYQEEIAWGGRLAWAIIQVLPDIALTNDLVAAVIALARRMPKDELVWSTVSSLWQRADLSADQRRFFYAVLPGNRQGSSTQIGIGLSGRVSASSASNAPTSAFEAASDRRA